MELIFRIDVVNSSNFLHKGPVTILSIKPRALNPAINIGFFESFESF